MDFIKQSVNSTGLTLESKFVNMEMGRDLELLIKNITDFKSGVSPSCESVVPVTHSKMTAVYICVSAGILLITVTCR